MSNTYENSSLQDKLDMAKFDLTGIILYTVNYSRCVEFYKNTLELTILFEADGLTCFEFGNAYLMVEWDDETNGTINESARHKTCLRMNVPNVKKYTNRLKARHVAVDYQEHPWGTIAKFLDPDGNLCAFKDSKKFEEQIAEYKRKALKN
ncbi:VOC family protein [Dyadobacter jejuensis]|nr:VOC family protein [Dyadobacter jejuensis]